MLTKTSLIVLIIFLGQLEYIVMSDSEKKSKYSFFEKKIRFTPFFVARTKTLGVEVKASDLVGFYTFIYLKKYFYLNPFVTRPGDLRNLGRPFRYEARRSPGLIAWDNYDVIK